MLLEYTIYFQAIVHQLYLDAILYSPVATDTLDGLLSKVLSSFNGQLNCFLKGDALKYFARQLHYADIITSELNSTPTYNEIEEQFTALLSCLSTNEIEVQCKEFLYALYGQDGPLKVISSKLGDKWRVKANAALKVQLCLNMLNYDDSE